MKLKFVGTQMVIKDLGPNFCIWVIFGFIRIQILFILKQQLNLRWSEARVCGHPAGGRLSSTGADSTDSRQISTDSAHSLGRQCTLHTGTVTVHYCTFTGKAMHIAQSHCDCALLHFSLGTLFWTFTTPSCKPESILQLTMQQQEQLKYLHKQCFFYQWQ